MSRAAPGPGSGSGGGTSAWPALLWEVDQLALALFPQLTLQAEPPPEPGYVADAHHDTAGYRRWIGERVRAGLEPPSPSAPGAQFVPSDDRPEPPWVAAPDTGPVVSILCPVYRPQPWYLRRCLESVRAQTYQRWQLCLCDDASGDLETTAILEEHAAADDRIIVTAHRDNGGISRATDTALQLATGTWTALLDHDDELAPQALARMVAAIEAHPDADIVYSDEDKFAAEDGLRFAPLFKPGWSPDLLLSYPYLGHLLVLRTELLRELGGLRPEFDGSQDYDLMLRATERATEVVHVPEVLYHWRIIPGSAAGDPDAKPWARQASRRVLEETLGRRGEDAWVEDGPMLGIYHVRRRVTGAHRVSIIVPFRDQARLLRTCVDTLSAEPGWDDIEFVLVDNDSQEPETAALLQRLAERHDVVLAEHPGEFNWSAINNAAVTASSGDMLLFMNNDIEARQAGWLRAMLEHAQRPRVGAVGARLLYPSGRLQHGGVVLGIGGIAGHIMNYLPSGEAGHLNHAVVIRNYTAVTAACLLCRREVYDEVDGFDEQLAVAFNDVDFCLRVRDAGYDIVYTPLAELVHHESYTRGFTGFYADYRVFLDRWFERLRHGDPLYNANLSRIDPRCVLRPLQEDEEWDGILSRLMNW